MKATKMNAVLERIRNVGASAMVGSMLLASGAVGAAEFTDRINNAKSIDTKVLRENAKSGADNFGFIIALVGMVIGLVVFMMGIMWVMSAAKSEGRKDAKAGWIMIGGGGALGAATGLFLYVVGFFSGAAA